MNVLEPDLVVATCYVNALASKPALYTLYEEMPVPGSKLYEYRLIEPVGRGAYAQVWKAQQPRLSGHDLALKEIAISRLIDQLENDQNDGDDQQHNAQSNKSVERKTNGMSLNRLKREVKILLNLKQSGCNSRHIIQIYDWFYDSLLRNGYIVMNFVPHDTNALEVYARWTLKEIKYYLYQLLQAVHACHENGIIHADIKPRNILIDEQEQELYLSDFGHARFYFPKAQYSCGVGTVGYRAPELLFEYPHYHYAIDMWSVGCVFLLMLVPSAHVLFQSTSNYAQIVTLTHKFGTQLMNDIAVTRFNQERCYFGKSERTHEQSWYDVITQCNVSVDSNRLEWLQEPHTNCILDRMLCLDPQTRITAKQALQDPFFSLLD